MMDWSYGLLGDDEQQVLNQLAVFAGSFSLSGVEAVVASTATSVLDVMDSLVEQSLVVASVDSGRYRLLETVRLYALDRLLNTDQLAATRDRHLAWMDALSGREFWPSVAEGETWEAAEQQLAEVANALAAMDWAEQTSQHDALLSLYIGGQTTWASTGGLAMAWLDRISEPPASEPNLRSEWLTTSGDIRLFAGDDANGYAQLLEAAAIVEELIGADQPFSPSTTSLIALVYRGIYLGISDVSAGLAESDRLNDLQIDGEPRLAEWFSLMVRTYALMFDGDDAALASVMQMETVGRTISRYADDNTAVTKAMLLSHTDRYDEALAAAMQCLDSQILAQSSRLNSLVPAAKSLAALGLYEAALDVVEKDFGPMIDAQRARFMSNQLVALVLILHQLQRHERINEIAGVASAYTRDSGVLDADVRIHLADIIGGDEALAKLPTPDPADLTTDQVATLIEDIITEIRDPIVHRAPEPLAEAPTKAV